MGRTPGNGAPSFRFSQQEVSQMEAMLTKYEGQVPPRDLLETLAQRFSNSPERAGKMVVQMKQVWNWFQNRRYALRAKLGESPGIGKPSSSPVGPVTRGELTPKSNVRSVPQHTAVSSGPHVAANNSDAPINEYEAKSARDGAWYDVQLFLSIRNVDTDNPDDAEALVRFAGFGPEEDEWIKVVKNIRQRSLPCEASECFVVTPGDLILCFQEGKEQALYFDAHVLDAQRRRHDVRGCRCRYLVRYDHDQSEEIVPLRKICRRPETDYRLQAPASTSMNVEPPVANPTSAINLGMTNPNPVTPPVTVTVPPPSPAVNAGSSFQPPAPFSAPAPTLTRAPTPAPFSAPAPTLFSFGPPGFRPISGLTPSVTALPPVSSPFSVPVTLPVAATPFTTFALETPATVLDQKTVTFSGPVSDTVTVMVSETPATVPDQKPFIFSATVSGPAETASTVAAGTENIKE